MRLEEHRTFALIDSLRQVDGANHLTISPADPFTLQHSSLHTRDLPRILVVLLLDKMCLLSSNSQSMAPHTSNCSLRSGGGGPNIHPLNIDIIPSSNVEGLSRQMIASP